LLPVVVDEGSANGEKFSRGVCDWMTMIGDGWDVMEDEGDGGEDER